MIFLALYSHTLLLITRKSNKKQRFSRTVRVRCLARRQKDPENDVFRMKDTHNNKSDSG